MKKITEIEISDHAKERIDEYERLDVDKYDHANNLKDLIWSAIRDGERCCHNDELRSWADSKRKNSRADLYYVWQDRIFAFDAQYRTFLKDQCKAILVTVLYHPKKKAHYYYGENLINKELPEFDKSLSHRVYNSLEGFILSIDFNYLSNFLSRALGYMGLYLGIEGSIIGLSVDSYFVGFSSIFLIATSLFLISIIDLDYSDKLSFIK